MKRFFYSLDKNVRNFIYKKYFLFLRVLKIIFYFYHVIYIYFCENPFNCQFSKKKFSVNL